MAKKTVKRKASKKKSSRRINKAELKKRENTKITEEPTEFVNLLDNFELEANRSMSIGLDINNNLHNVKFNDIDKADKKEDSKGNGDLAGKFYTVILKLREANALHEKNFYKLNKLF